MSSDGLMASLAPFTAPSATGLHSDADRVSRPRAGRSARARTRRPRCWGRRRGRPGKPARCPCVRGRPLRRSRPVRPGRAARPRSACAACRPRRQAAGSPATGASAIPRERRAAAARADRHRRPERDRPATGGSGPGPAPACLRAGARCRAPRGSRFGSPPDRMHLTEAMNPVLAGYRPSSPGPSGPWWRRLAHRRYSRIGWTSHTSTSTLTLSNQLAGKPITCCSSCSPRREPDPTGKPRTLFFSSWLPVMNSLRGKCRVPWLLAKLCDDGTVGASR